jgi:PAS domain S-box-containing protein
MQHLLNILHLEDDRLDGDLIRETLAAQGTVAEMQLVQTERAFRAALLGGGVDLVLSDYSLPDFNGPSALRIVREMDPELPFIFVSGTTGEEIAIESLKSGATDYILKDRLQRLGGSVQRALSEVEQRKMRRRQDEALCPSEARYKLLFDSNPLPTWVFSLETLAFLVVNEAAIQHYGYSREEFLEMTITELRPPEDLPKLNESREARQGLDQARMCRHLKKDGTRIQVETTSHGIEFFGQRAQLMLANDLTERNLAEKVRQSSELRYRRLFESAKDGILILDADSGKIVDVNPYLIELLGFSKEQLAGKELWEIGAFKDIIASKLAFAELRQRGYIRYENLPLESREGLVRQVEFVSNSYLAGDSRVIQCNIRDITRRKLAEKDLRETNQRLEGALAELQAKTHELASMTQQLWQASKLATMGELAASVAHELNNPLATLALHAESLLGHLPADDSKRRAVQVIEQEVERMATLVSNLLLFSRRSHPQTSTLDLIEELNNSLEFINYHLRSNQIAVVTDFASDLPSVHADRQQLRQVFLNLLTNGSDAMPEGGTLTVSARRQFLESGAAAAMIEFTDTGIGINPEDVPKLWEPFFTTKPEGRGTGLGLPICRRTVEEHQGTIDIESHPGKGTTVRIILPAIGEHSKREL